MSRRRPPVAAWLQRSYSPTTPRRRAVRDLLIERLESRVVLSGLPEVEAPISSGTVDPAAETPTIVESTIPAHTIDAQAADAMLAQTDLITAGVAIPTDTRVPTTNSFLPVGMVPDASTGGSTGPTAPLAGGGPSGGSGQPLLPPIIMDFVADSQGALWRFTGKVLDDTNVTGLTVFFGGLLAGHSTLVDRFGYFEIFISLGTNPTGTVSAYTVDLDGLRSETVSLSLG